MRPKNHRRHRRWAEKSVVAISACLSLLVDRSVVRSFECQPSVLGESNLASFSESPIKRWRNFANHNHHRGKRRLNVPDLSAYAGEISDEENARLALPFNQGCPAIDYREGNISPNAVVVPDRRGDNYKNGSPFSSDEPFCALVLVFVLPLWKGDD